ncbi:uncharacterized WD repeat-containing protein alr3466-like [Condylostylus longicornis]|uniref:uncharacterized WD repeat-containing protein alr3466-like n=1 Tax=Condylostylus longicornis TaxID=2530218 RepID=UPI00244E04F0|nr:uncharacterized WD repeat-containing protein alr3466-like [Condylostylus longicornis]
MANLNEKNVRILQILEGHKSDVTCIEFWGNVLLFTGSSDKTIRLWKWIVGSGFVEESISPLRGHTYGVTSVKISPHGGVLASSSKDGSIILWDISNGTKTNILYQENGEGIRCCSFSPNGECIVAAGDCGTICIWNQDKNLVKTYHYHEETIYTMSFSSDSNILLTGCNDGQIRLLAINKTTENNESNPINPDYDCGIDNAHDLGVTSSDFFKTVHTDPLNRNTGIYTAITGGTDQLVKIWRIFFLIEKSDNIDEINRLIPGLGDHESNLSTIYSTKSMNAECVQVINCHGSSITCVKLNKRGTMFMTASLDKTIKLWNNQGKLINTLVKHKRYVNCLSINDSSNILASGSNDKNVIIWDLTSSLTLESHIARLSSMIFNLASNDRNVIPSEFLCPLTHEIMNDPVILEDKFTYEKSAINEWFNSNQNKSPITNEELNPMRIMDNIELKQNIENFLKSMDFDSFNTVNLNENE